MNEINQTNGIFEIHIAGPQIKYEEMIPIFKELETIGLVKNKFFLKVYNVPSNGCYKQSLDTPPTGHDLDQPGWMTTAKVKNFEEAQKLINLGMEILAKHNLKGNFEVERIITDLVEDFKINVEKDFPDFKKIEDAPDYENHFIWKDELNKLPSFEEIIKAIQEKFGISPHQIVDFARDFNASEKTVVSRVATIYQPSREEALKYAKKLKESEKILNHKYAVTEQVCLVGEPNIECRKKDNAALYI